LYYRINEAEKMLKRAVMYFKLCLNPSNNFVLLSLATLGTFYKIFNKPREAVLMFREVIDSVGKLHGVGQFFVPLSR